MPFWIISLAGLVHQFVLAMINQLQKEAHQPSCIWLSMLIAKSKIYKETDTESATWLWQERNGGLIPPPLKLGQPSKSRTHPYILVHLFPSIPEKRENDVYI